MTSSFAFNYCKPEVVKELQVIHYGSEKFDLSKFKTVLNNPRDYLNNGKPLGGLWSSPINSKLSWIDCCQNANQVTFSENDSFQMRFHDSAIIAVIDNYLDLANLPMVKEPQNAGETFIDWEKVRVHVDAIWLTSDGVLRTQSTVPYCLKHWQCESIIILNSQCFYQI